MKWKVLSLLVLIMLLSALNVSCGNMSDNNGDAGINDQGTEETNDLNSKAIPMTPNLESILFDPVIKDNVYLEGKNMGGLKASEVRERIRKAAEKMYVAPEDAKLDPKKWEISKKEKPGKRVNVDKTLENLIKSGEGAKHKLVIEKVEPEKTAEKLMSNIVEIGSYSTPLLDKQWRRMRNIRIATKKVNNTILNPGEEFSFNRIVGPRSKERGYREAPIIIKTPEGPKKKDDIGGGICQLSSTIYNVAEQCGMEITERHMHSTDVPYVPEGKDATVTYNDLDFRFRNNRQYPIMIKVILGKDKLTVKFLENRN